MFDSLPIGLHNSILERKCPMISSKIFDWAALNSNNNKITNEIFILQCLLNILTVYLFVTTNRDGRYSLYTSDTPGIKPE